MVVKDIGMFSLENLYLDKLDVDERYQRTLNDKLASYIEKEFNQLLCGPLTVGKRPDGSLWVIDGQTRRAALLARGIDSWPCVIATTTAEQESSLFVSLNEYRRQVSRLEKFRASVFGNDDAAVAIQELVSAAGFSISKKPGHIAGVGVLETAYRLGTIRDVIWVMDKWRTEFGITDAAVIRGLHLFFMRKGHKRGIKWTRDRVEAMIALRRLEDVQKQARLMQTAMGGGSHSGGKAIADALVFFYNKGIGHEKRLKFSYE